METRRFIRSTLFLTLALIIVTVLIPQKALAWGNVGAHPEINRLAIELFQQRQTSDPVLKNISLSGDPCWGIAWDPADGNSLINRIDEKKRQKTLKDWIIDAGYSADEPEGPMAMRHFYDPTNKSKAYLTDTDWVAGFLRKTLGSIAVNPEISAVDWAMNRDEGIGERETYFEQKYSYPDAKEYLKKALADKSRDNEYYGQAWRAVGETMHLMADMGCPAHVRNDGHGIGDADPLEDATSASIVRNNNNQNLAASINYNQNVEKIMQELAAYTNENFFSKDTIPVSGKSNTANGRPAYTSPSVANPAVNKLGYLEGKVNGETVKMARQSIWYRWGLSKNKGYELDGAVIKDQQRILIPTVVRSAEAVIERFLPRFEASVSVKPDLDISGKYLVSGSIKPVASPEWNENLIIRNGAYIMVNNNKEAAKLFANDNLNQFTQSVSAKAGDQVKVIYDLGGYVIQSNVVKIGDLAIDPATLTGETGKEYTFKAITTSPPSNPRYEWSVNNSVKQNDSNSSFKTKFSAQGEYTVTVKLKDSAGKEIGTANAKVTIQAAAQKEYAWKFVEIVDVENKEAWDLQATDTYYKFEHSYGQGNFSSRGWHQDKDLYVAYGAKAVWSKPPPLIKAGEKVTLTVTLSETENTHKNSATGANASADFASPSLGPGQRGKIDFANASGETYAVINGAGPTSDSETLTAIAPAGRVGERIAIRVCYYQGISMGTYYVYEWQEN